MARVFQQENGDVVLRLTPLEVQCLEALSVEGADAFADDVIAGEVFRSRENIRVAKGVFRTVVRARKLATA